MTTTEKIIAEKIYNDFMNRINKMATYDLWDKRLIATALQNSILTAELGNFTPPEPKEVLSDKQVLLNVVQAVNVPIMPAMKDTKVFINAIEIGNTFKVWKAEAIRKISKL